MTAEGVVNKSVSKVSASLYVESGVCDAHLAIYAAPTTTGGSDGALLQDLDDDDATIVLKTYQSDAVGVGLVEKTLELDMPTNRQPSTYIVRLWVDNLTGQTTETTDRDADSSTSDEPAIPAGVQVTKIVVS